MSSKMNLSDFLKRVEGVYKSIDLRYVAVNADNTHEWHNVLTVMRFSYLHPDSVAETQKVLMDKWGGKIETANFRIEMRSCDFKFLEAWCCNYFKQGRFFFSQGNDMQFGRGIDLFSLIGNFEHHGYTRRDNYPWPCFEACNGNHSPLLNNERLELEVKSFALVDTYSLINELLEVDFSRSLELDLIVDAPFYATIKKFEFEEQKCQVQVKFHNEIKALSLSVIARKGQDNTSPVRDKASSQIKSTESKQLDESMKLWTKQFEMPNATPTDYLCVNLIQTMPIALEIETPSYATQISTFLESKKPLRAPLVAAFRRFCRLDELEEYLTNPATAKPFIKGKKDANIAYEWAVQWLLGLCGFNLVWLGQTNHEVLKENDVTRFSIDILASHLESKNILLLIGCTIGNPKDNDIDNLKSLRSLLQGEIFKNTQIHIKPVIFSAAPELGNKERSGVKLLDADDMRGMLNLLRKNEIKRALNQYFGHELGFKL